NRSRRDQAASIWLFKPNAGRRKARVDVMSWGTAVRRASPPMPLPLCLGRGAGPPVPAPGAPSVPPACRRFATPLSSLFCPLYYILRPSLLWLRVLSPLPHILLILSLIWLPFFSHLAGVFLSFFPFFLSTGHLYLRILSLCALLPVLVWSA